jgi:hypothetical protein
MSFVIKYTLAKYPYPDIQESVAVSTANHDRQVEEEVTKA